MDSGGPPTSASRYLAGLCVAALGLCAGGWLILTPFAFGYPGRGRAAVTALGTGGGLVVVCAVSLACWALLWRRKLRADGVLPPRQTRGSRRSAKRQARAERLVHASRQHELVAAPDPAQVLTDLRALLTPLLADSGGVEVLSATANGSHGAADGSDADECGPADSGEVADVARAGEVAGVAEGSRQVQAPGHLRGTRSASFFADTSGAPAEPLLRGAELLMVGTGEEEAW